MKAMRLIGVHRGFSIVEALVALIVLSVGMLGIAALYVESLQAGRSAVYRTHAVNLASDMADRIRANRNAGIQGNAYVLAAGDNPAVQGCADTGGGSSACDQVTLAEDDLARWLAAIRDTLPGNGNGTPSGTVAVDPATAPTQYTITVTWSEPGEAQPLSYVVSMQI